MSKNGCENQLDVVRGMLDKLPRNEWAKLAVDADVALRTVYSVNNPANHPRYETVYRLYSALLRRPAKKGARQ